MPSHPIVQVEIRLRDLKRGAAFYQGAFGWHVEETHPGAYAVADTGALPLVGLMQTADPGVPIGVAPYALSEDVAADVARARDLGGTVLADCTDSGAGLWGHTLDPWGNELAFWEPRGAFDPALKGSGEHAVVWAELRAPDLPEAVRYYKKLCGWSFQVTPDVDDFAFAKEPGSDLGVGLVGGRRAQELRALTIYVRVADLELAARRVVDHGGEVSRDSPAGPEGGRFRIVTDPSGNTLGLFQER